MADFVIMESVAKTNLNILEGSQKHVSLFYLQGCPSFTILLVFYSLKTVLNVRKQYYYPRTCLPDVLFVP